MEDDMLNDFYVEAEELFDEAEDSLLSIEKSDDYGQCFNSVFRTFHSIKGAAGMFGIERLQEHMHFIENLLETKKQLPTMSSLMIDYLLNGVDAARKLLKDDDVEFEYYDPDAPKGNPPPKVDEEITKALKAQVQKRSSSTKNDGIIFVVDDEQDICELMQEYLETNNYLVHTYNSGPSALKELKDKNPDLIISDIKMPEMNGIELMQEVNKVKPHLPVIVVSGMVTKEVCLDAFACGVAGVLEKPYDPEQLMSMCNILINRSKNLKLLNRSIDLLVYQFENFDKFLLEKCGEAKRDTFRHELKSVLSQKKVLFEGL